jgi:hypothetical protein
MNYRTICGECAHFSEEAREEDHRPTCAAFPGGIPDEILFDGFDHREPHPDDNGIQFEPADDVDPDTLDQLLAPTAGLESEV